MQPVLTGEVPRSPKPNLLLLWSLRALPPCPFPSCSSIFIHTQVPASGNSLGGEQEKGAAREVAKPLHPVMRKPLRIAKAERFYPRCVRGRETLTATEIGQAGPAGVGQALDGVGEQGDLGVPRDTAEGHCEAHSEALLLFEVPTRLGVGDIWQRPAVPCGGK